MNSINIVTNTSTLIFVTLILLVIGVLLFLIGYLYGKTTTSGVLSEHQESNTVYNKGVNSTKRQQINIDDTKFVVDIKTDDLEKKYEQLGEVKKSDESISESVSKLKNLKR
jgi:hypothetical protein